MFEHALITLRDRIGQVLAVLAANRMRTGVSMLGVAFGVAALLVVQVTTDAGRRVVFSELETYGLTTLWIFRDWQQDRPSIQRPGSGIDNDDYAAIQRSRCCPDVRRFSAVVYPQNWMVNLSSAGRMSQSSVEGVDVDYLIINNDRVVAGRGLRHADVRGKRPVAVVGPVVRERLFGNRSAVGQTLRMGEVQFTVVGELAHKDRSLLTAIGATQGYDVNNRVLIPYTLYQQIMGGSRDIQTLQAQAVSLARAEQAGRQVVRFLERRNQKRYRYTVQDMRSWIATAERILGVITLVGGVGAGVALLVGGMGILGIMSTAVMERTREIGLRKAVGAKGRDILVQFVAEAGVIGLLGALMGWVLATLVLLGVRWWSGFWFFPSGWQILLAMAMAVGAALAAGVLPAKRAAALPPAEALRHD